MRLQINKVLATAIFFQLKYPQAHVIYRGSRVSLSCKSQMEKNCTRFYFLSFVSRISFYHYSNVVLISLKCKQNDL